MKKWSEQWLAAEEHRLPAVAPGDVVALRADMATGEFVAAGVENVGAPGVEIFCILNSANKPSGSITLSDDKRRQAGGRR